MDIRILPEGSEIRVSQSLGLGARGCRLDSGALEMAVARVGASFGPAADLLIVNRVGKHEAEGRGFRDVIAEAVAMDIPVLVGLNALNRPAFEDFAEGLATRLPPEPAALMAWVDDVTATADMLV